MMPQPKTDDRAITAITGEDVVGAPFRQNVGGFS